MNLYLAIKYYPDAANRVLIEALADALSSVGHQVTCIARDLEHWGAVHFAADELMRRSFCAIDAADLVLVELSEKGVGLGIEAGYAHAEGIPIIVIARHGSPISETMRGIATAVAFYTEPSEVTQITLPVVTRTRPTFTWAYIVRSVDRLLACLNDLDRAAINHRPLPTGNSLYVLATHMVGNIEETVWGILCGQPIERNREAEFQAVGADTATIRQHWRTLQAKIEQHVATLSAADLSRSYHHPRRGPLSGNELLVVVARHAAEHLAQAEMTRELVTIALSNSVDD
ncbi:MAG: DinB family protein [Caldilineaceae bacterium]